MTALPLTAPAPAVHRSRKLIPPFRLHRPLDAADALTIKAGCGPGGAFMAGGIDLVNRMKYGGEITDVIHLAGVAGLDGITESDGRLRIGSLVTHDRLANSPLVRAQLPELAQTWPGVANIRIRCKGTIGGNIMAEDPAYDFPLAMLAANARLEILTADGATRQVAAADVGSTAGDGLLTAVTVPTAASCRLSFDRSLRPIVTLALGLDIESGVVASARIAIGCAYARPIPIDLPIAEPVPLRALAAQAERLAGIVAASLPEPFADRHAGGAYRRRMIGVLLRRQLAASA